MLSENRKSELAGISREQWEWEHGASQRAINDAEFIARALLVEPIPIPKKTEERILLERRLGALLPDLGVPAYLMRSTLYQILLIARGVDGRILRRFAVRNSSIQLPVSPLASALNDFIASGIDWIAI